VAVSFPQRGTWAARSARLAREAARPRLPSRGFLDRLRMSHSVQDACRGGRPRRIGSRTSLDEEGCRDGCGRVSAEDTPSRFGTFQPAGRGGHAAESRTRSSASGGAVGDEYGHITDRAARTGPSRRPPTRREPQLPIHRRQPAYDCSTLWSCSPKANLDARRHLTNSNSRLISVTCSFIMTAGSISMIGGVSAISKAGLDAVVGPIPAPAY
jgi:hypothetical protein